MMSGLDQFGAAVRWAVLDHYRETGTMPDFDAATLSLGRWEDGQTFLRITLASGHCWELAFDAAAAEIEAAKATKH